MVETIRFKLNGRPVRLKVDGERKLLWVLRTDLGVTGPKYGCGEGLCGACTVLADDAAMLSCQKMVKEVDGSEITTIEGLAKNGRLHPLQFRLKHLKDQRMIRVLQAAARKFGWQSIKTPSGRGHGIACGIDAGTYVAFMAEVEVDRESGSVDVKRVVCAQDMGVVVNPEGATTQMEGCITMGLGYALTEEIHFADGEIFDLNFDTYALPRFSWLPKIETVILENPDLAPQGGGEPAIIGMGGVIATAIYDAVGAAVFQLPMTPERVKAAIKQA